MEKEIKVHFLNDSSQGIGGGWSFLSNLQKSFKHIPELKVAGRIEDSDICFVAGPTMVTRQTIDKVQELGKKLVVRLDNVPRNSRNRNTGTSRLKEFSERADGVVWQCGWARDYLKDFIKPKFERIIYNSVDEEIFKPEGNAEGTSIGGGDIYIYSRFNRDETKNWEVAWYKYQLIHRELKNTTLELVGNFSPEHQEYNFDFFRGENIRYLGIVTDPNRMASIYRGADYLLATYFNDCFSNTYLEALMCGMELVEVDMSGGTPEMLKIWKESNGREFFGLRRLARDYYNFFKEISS